MFKNANINILLASFFSITAYAADLTTSKIEVVSQTPLPSLGVSLDQYSSTVQNIKAVDLKKSQTLDLTAYLNENLTGVHINDYQNNPLQADVNYRGFTASSLLGTPQGLSVYLDGMRFNQPFGDTVSWDLIPKNAIASTQLYSGSNPLFGLNTLGGALSINTKDGRNNPGGALQFTTGSGGRKVSEFEYGGVSKDNSVDYFVAATWFDEDGWRDRSSSENKQIFAKLGWRGDKTDAKMTYAFSDSDLNGNGTTPMSQLQRNWSSVYTYPDNTQNKSHLLKLDLNHYFNANTLLSGNAYYRNIKSKTYNGDVNEGAFADYLGGGTQTIMVYDRYLRATETLGGSAKTSYDLAAQQLACSIQNTRSGGEAGEKCTGVINRTQTNQESWGAFAQISRTDKLFNRDNNYILGGGYEISKVRFAQSAEFANLMNDGGMVGTGYYATEYRTNPQNMDGDLDYRDSNVKTKTNIWSAYGSDTISLSDNLFLTGAARYNHLTLKMRDQFIHHGPEVADVTAGNINPNASLDGDHTYARLNPSVGLTFKPVENVSLYGNYNEGSRAPTPMELGCADPNQGCKLPSSMTGDPHLKQVVARTFEMGARGRAILGVNWQAAIYNTRSDNDIIFVGSKVAGKGYFRNFEQTQKRGIDLALNKKFDSLSLAANYSYLESTYESGDSFVSNWNDSSGTATGPAGSQSRFIEVKKGSEIPGAPNNIFKLFANYDLNEKLRFSANTLSVGSIWVRGAENNQGTGSKLPGYTVMNIAATYEWASGFTLFGKVNNLLDKEYYTGGQLGFNAYDANGLRIKTAGTSTSDSTCGTGYGCRRNSSDPIMEAFAAPGAPISGWVGIRYEFGGAKKSTAD